MKQGRIFGQQRIPPTLAVLLLLSGCAEEWGPEPMSTARVSGRLHQSGEPITRGWLEFTPVDGIIGRLRSVPIGEDGQFDAVGVPVGRVAIRLVGARLQDPEIAIFGQISLIRRSIPEYGTEVLEIDLDVERATVASGRTS